MNPIHHEVATSIGNASYVEVPTGDQDVLLLHTPGQCAGSMGLVMAGLAGAARSIAVDLPGHAGSRTTPITPLEQVDWVIELIELLELDRPVLVGVDLSGFVASAVALKRPELVGGVVTIGEWCINTREESQERFELVHEPEFIEEMTDRMYFGYEGPDEESRGEMIEALAGIARRDWLLDDRDGKFTDQLQHLLRCSADGSWQRYPLPNTYLTMYTIDPDAEVYPERELLTRLTVPTLALVGEEGVGADLVPDAIDFLADSPHVRVLLIGGGNAPQMTHPGEVAQAIRALMSKTRAEV